MGRRAQHCFNCGEELGFYDSYGELEACDKRECQRELRYALETQDAEARERAQEDNYGRYR